MKAVSSAAQWLAAGLEQKSCPIKACSSGEEWLALACRMPFGCDAQSALARVVCCEKCEVNTSAVNDAVEVPVAKEIPLPSFCRSRRVSFDLAATIVHDIQPYAEVYDQHPRTFVFDRDGQMIPAAPGGFVSLQAMNRHAEESDDEDVSYHPCSPIQWQ